eukprot:CAMPEP_0170183588 /NCGR_PEP_ID=MMETSP0040_2-20121228/31174_1 /TAXON_ID=641309 /ORGANISM="Lotharella oceanica, Strain CCMP622" /LENGTH=77 /DNA_ID=CAMNT_0010429383 /DNA_START=39 /DNA_END=269 /DNA_ORIENTATION=+
MTALGLPTPHQRLAPPQRVAAAPELPSSRAEQAMTTLPTRAGATATSNAPIGSVEFGAFQLLHLFVRLLRDSKPSET